MFFRSIAAATIALCPILGAAHPAAAPGPGIPAPSPARVVSGRSEVPSRKQGSGILFYVRESRKEIEMVSVGADGLLWTMTGPLGGETRLSQEYKTTHGGTGRLRFTRSNVSPDAFESGMEYTDDGGKSWKPGNHQRFSRIKSGKE